MPGLFDTRMPASMFLGPFVGAIFNVLIFGIICVLTWSYYSHYPKDRKVVKTIVAVSFFFLLVQTIAIIITQWDTFVLHEGDMEYFKTFSIPAKVALSVIYVPVILAKCLFAERCHWVSRSVPVFVIGVGMIVIAAICSIGSIISRVHPASFKSDDAVNIWYGVYLWSAVASDVWLTGAFAWSIQRMKRDNALHPAALALLSHLLRIALLTSGLTTIGAFAAAISQLVSPNAYGAFRQIMPQAYMLSVLITLNTRKQIKDRVMTLVTPGGFVGPRRPPYDAMREKRTNLLPYRSLFRPSVQYTSGLRGDAGVNGVGVDCDTRIQVEILETDSFTFNSSASAHSRESSLGPDIEILNPTLISLHLDPAPYHANFNAAVIPRRLFEDVVGTETR